MAQGSLVGYQLMDSSGHKLADVHLEPQSEGFTYANIGSWTASTGTSDFRLGDFVFGTPTAAGDVPVTGTANYAGIIAGQTNEAFLNQPSGTFNPSTISGTVSMSFDFGAGQFSGQIAPVLSCWECLWDMPLQTLHFSETVYSAGSTSYSGKFDTPLAGPNSFNGIFAGPNAAETMAQFQAPYLDPYTGDAYKMTGVWVAKKTP
jgi:hypothetical protein